MVQAILVLLVLVVDLEVVQEEIVAILVDLAPQLQVILAQ